MAALNERAQQRRAVAGELCAELDDILAHCVDLFGDAKALKARSEHADIALGE